MFKVGDRVRHLHHAVEGVVIETCTIYTRFVDDSGTPYGCATSNLGLVIGDPLLDYDAMLIQAFNGLKSMVPDHSCSPYVGISHVENTCVYCSRRMTNQEVQLYLSKVGI